MKFYIETFGCKVNSYESNYIKNSLLKDNFIETDNLNDADIIIVNTCTVTNTADSKCKKFIRKVRREKENAILVVMGCSVQNNPTDYEKLNIDILLGNRYKSRVCELIKNYLINHEKYEFIDANRNLDFENMAIDDFDHTRAFIKIQDGCDNFCSYCIIPFVRGKNRSKNFDTILEEARALVQNNHLEIVLTGIHTGSYNYDGKDLVDLINELSKIEKLERIRLSSVEITELNAKFMNMLKENKKFCDHLHIPLQAGSDNILQKMNRKYDLAYFAKVIKQIRVIRPNISITTDIIVGFPGESEEDFQNTYRFSQKIKFSKIHVFPYSKRNGTKSSMMSEVNDKEKTNRVHKLLELSAILEKNYSDSFKGKKMTVLIEEVHNNISIGHTSNYLRVEVPQVLNKNQMYEIEY